MFILIVSVFATKKKIPQHQELKTKLIFLEQKIKLNNLTISFIKKLYKLA